MTNRCLILTMVLTATCFAQSAEDHQLVVDLSKAETRQAAIDRLRQAGNSGVALLLDIAAGTYDAAANPHALKFGAAEAFCEIRTEKAIPFLIANITIQTSDWPDIRTWTRAHEVMIARLPAVRALGALGSPVLDAIFERYLDPMMHEERLAIILVLERLEGPEALAFLDGVRKEIAEESRFVASALERRTAPR